jgi:hypothetical protein
VLLPADDSRLVGRSGTDKVSLLIKEGNPGASDPESTRINSAKAGRLGYVDRSFAKKDGLTMVSVENANGEFVDPTDDAIVKGVEGGTHNADGTTTPDFSNAVAGAYPLWTITYAVVPTSTTTTFDETKGQALATFLDYVVSDEGQTTAAELGFVPLPQELREKAAAAIDQIPVPQNPTGANQPGVTNTTPGAFVAPVDATDPGLAELDAEVPADPDATPTDGPVSESSAAVEDAGEQSVAVDAPGEAAAAETDGAESAADEVANPTVSPIAAILGSPVTMLGLPAIFLLGLIALAVGPVLRRQPPGQTT